MASADRLDGDAGAAVVARGLTKRFGDFVAVDGIDLTVHRGECFGILGPNGAGKSTTMRMVGCVSPPDSGVLEVLGLDVREHGRAIKARLGVVPQVDNLDTDLSVLENLLVYANYYGIPWRTARVAATEALAFMGLADRAGHRISELSGGMQRRLVIARALQHDPDVLLLDEPTTGLDPQARHHIWDRLRTLRESGTTLLLTTHYMEEAAHLCDRLVMMAGGRVLVLGTPRDLIRDLVPRYVIEIPRRLVDPEGALVDALNGDAAATHLLADRLVVHADETEPILRRLAASGVDQREVFERMASLEDVFLELTGRADGEVTVS